MKIYRSRNIENLKLENTAVAIGGFDAMHIGHLQIIKKAVSNADVYGLKSLVFMFENNPAEVITKAKIPSVNDLNKRIDILKSLNVDIVVTVKFDTAFMNISKDDFFNEFLMDKLGAKSISVGFNFRFGKNGGGDTSYLKEQCEKNNIGLDVISKVTIDDTIVSSTQIRELVSDGKVLEASKLLGCFFSISGTIVKGNQIGKKLLGFPTANIEIPKDCVIPHYGVYVSQAVIDNVKYPSITNVGDKPTVEKNHIGIETYIIDNDFGDLYEKNIEVEFCKYLRNINSFANMDELVKQLSKDKNDAIKFFKEYKENEKNY